MTVLSPLVIAANNVDLSLSAASLSGDVRVFGDMDIVDEYLRADDQQACKPYLYGERLLEIAGQPNTQLLTKNNDPGIVIRHGNLALKYCWEASALQEAVAADTMRLGLIRLASEDHRIRTPRVIGGISSRQSGILMMEYIAVHTQVDDLDAASQKAFDDDKPRRTDLYERIARDADFFPPLRRTLGLDDGPYNTLWPDDFVTSSEQPLPTTMVRVDFGADAKQLARHITWPSQTS